MFEQSVLTPHPTNTAWSVPFSIAAEVLTVGLLVIVPLIYTNQLPGVRLSMELVAPPSPASPEPASHARESALQPRLAMRPRVFVFVKNAADRAPLTISGMVFAPPDLGVPGSVGTLGTSGIADAMLHTGAASKPPAPAIAQSERAPGGPVHVGGHVQEAKLIRKVIPTYPTLAKQARISGVVRLVGIIGKDGNIENLQVISGHPMLVSAALDAVRQWVYRPTLLNGQPVEVIAPIEISFTLQ
ncbi:MAG: energy transducer TonB [Bryobacteraceae bacterium]